MIDALQAAARAARLYSTSTSASGERVIVITLTEEGLVVTGTDRQGPVRAARELGWEEASANPALAENSVLLVSSALDQALSGLAR